MSRFKKFIKLWNTYKISLKKRKGSEKKANQHTSNDYLRKDTILLVEYVNDSFTFKRNLLFSRRDQ